MASTQIEIQPLALADLPILHAWLQSEEAFGPYDEPSRLDFETLSRTWQTDPTWLIISNGKQIGFCNSRRHEGNDWVAIIAVIIVLPPARGKGIGTRVHQLLCNLIFAQESKIHKIEAYTDVENLAEQRVLEKCGFLREELLRKVSLVRGEVRDMYLYGLLRK